MSDALPVNQKALPVATPLIDSFADSANLLSILQAQEEKESFMNWVLEHYTGLYVFVHRKVDRLTGLLTCNRSVQIYARSELPRGVDLVSLPLLSKAMNPFIRNIVGEAIKKRRSNTDVLSGYIQVVQHLTNCFLITLGEL